MRLILNSVKIFVITTLLTGFLIVQFNSSASASVLENQNMMVYTTDADTLSFSRGFNPGFNPAPNSVLNKAPKFSSPAIASVLENQRQVYTATAIDSDSADKLTFSIHSGPDQNAFSIDATSGELTLINAADFEAPSDANADGIFEVTLNVDDGNGGSDQLALTLSIEDVSQLNLNVSYPTPNANLGGAVAFTSVTGFIEDLEDGRVLGSDIESVSVRVNGQEANIEPLVRQSHVVRWRIQLPVSAATPKDNVIPLSIELRDRRPYHESIYDQHTYQQINQLLFNQPILLNSQGIVLDSANNRALVVDFHLGALIAIDLGSGTSSVFSEFANDNLGTGPNLVSPRGITLDSTNNRVLVVDSGLDALIAIDLDSGARTVLSDNNTGSGPNLYLPQDIALDSANNRVLVVDPYLESLIAIDLNSGARMVLSDDNTGTGADLEYPLGVVLDSANNRALVVDSGLDALIAIDLDSGARTVLSDDNIGSGPGLVNPNAITLDSTNNRVLVAGSSLGALIAIDLDSGARAVFANDNIGSEPNLEFPRDIALDSANNRALVVDNGLGALIAIDLDSGVPTVLFGNTGTGFDLVNPNAITLDSANNRALVLDLRSPLLGALLSIDLDSGVRTVLSDENTGSGSNLVSPRDITLDSANNRALVVDSSLNALIAIDLDSGVRTVLSDDKTGNGPYLENLKAIILDSANNRVLVITTRVEGEAGGSYFDFIHSLIAIDLDSGMRTVLSGDNIGIGPELVAPRDIALDSANNRVLVVDSRYTFGALIAIDLDSGARIVLSDNNTGGGVHLSFPRGIALDSANNRVLVVDSRYLFGALIAIDLDSGVRTVLSDNHTGTGPTLEPINIALDSANNRALVIDKVLDALITIELGSGERAISSR